MSECIVPYERPEALPSVREIGSFDLCQICLPGERESNAVGRYAGDGEKLKADEQQQGCCQERQDASPAPQHQV
ncbi:hypothetical protein GGE66_000884 [Rhizobium leguminosarum]|uniref:Uncharacterized protein n=1 Tax=Rhizobium leguminosarum TaxID=384 RepID=A0A7W9ZNH7_RHILE|nr:hypothetical protein [Rhizobium leguminosarum]